MKENPLNVYFSDISSEFNTGQATEHAYRPALKKLFETIVPTIKAVNDPKRSEYGAPDFALMKSKELSAGYVEAKDVPVKLDDEEKSEQMTRYLEYGSLILTNYLEFRFYRHGDVYGEPITIAKVENGVLIANEKAFFALEDSIRTFLTKVEPIRSSSKLAKIMGDKARRIRDKVKEYVTTESERNKELRRMYESFKGILIHDLTEEQFADMYAQTLVYGLFAGRYEDETAKDFSRQEARELVPKTNPFLRHFFDHITGANFDIRLTIIVNELCEIFKNSDVHALMHAYATQKGLLGEDKETADPVIHFYEDFLREYDIEQRKKLGAFYTPIPVVRFIIRAVDQILEKDFGLMEGLSDATKIKHKFVVQEHDSRFKDGIKRLSVEVHRVQILDPATGTGTFLNETIRHIHKKFVGQEGRWKSYVEEDLLPRLHGFELMMAPYTIAHLKIAMTLHDSGVTGFRDRLGIYLTNSLEEGIKVDDSLFGLGFGHSITEERRAASRVKNDLPIMVVIGNPPYSVSSTNKGEWIQNLIKIYKQDLNERKINLDDDYIKFLRFSEYFVEKNQNGIVAMITNNSFLDGVTHRQMRKHLLETFDDIYIFDLHGNSKKKEKTPNGEKDENVFDIMQGVSISIFVRKEVRKKGLANVYHNELYGKRSLKFSTLNNCDLKNIKWNKLNYSDPYFFFVPKDFTATEEYEKGFKIDEFFTSGSSGIESGKDDFIVQYKTEDLNPIREFVEVSSNSEIGNRYGLDRDKVDQVKKDIGNIIGNETAILYRPFDVRFTLYSPNSQGVWWRPRYDVMKHLVNKNNLGLIAKRGLDEERSAPCFSSRLIIDRRAWSRPGMQGAEQIFPLYLYSDDGSKILNIEKEYITKIEKIIGKVVAEDIFDFIYASLHSPLYRKKYQEFLKIDFPRVPYPKDVKSFRDLAALGRELRELHFLESAKLKNFNTTFPESGSDTIEAKYPKYKGGHVFINDIQFFGNVPEVAWNYYVGGYQPAQKWLKDRQGKKLSNEDIRHYQKIIVAIVETDLILQRIDEIAK